MPARIDVDRRRAEIVDAAFRLVVRDGIEAMSLRRVADEAGLNIGSVRHVLDGHAALVTAAVEEAGARMGRRLAMHPVDRLGELAGEAQLDALQELIESVLPVDPARLAEATVVLEFIMAARTRPEFRAVSATMAADLAAVVRSALDAVHVSDVDGATAQLVALVGGLTIDTITPHGELGPDGVRAVLRAHLRRLLDDRG